MDQATRKAAWAGGLVRGGRYVIREQAKGRRYIVTLRRGCTEDEALDELRAFRKDPAAYVKEARTPVAEPVHLDDVRLLGFLTWSRDEIRNTPKHVHDQKTYLEWWQDRIGGVDLRGDLSLSKLHDALSGATCRQQRIAAVKRFLSWLRKTGAIEASHDPTLFGALPVPASKPAQHRKSKVVPQEHVALVLERLGGRVWRDILVIQAGSGWHTSEVQRFAEAGTIEPLPRGVEQDGVAAVLVCPQRKSGEVQRTRVSASVLEAAKRIRAHGTFSRDVYDQALERACRAVKRPDGEIGIPPFTGAMMRHSVATWAIERGSDPASVAAFLGHKSPATTRKFYAVHASPTKVPTIA